MSLAAAESARTYDINGWAEIKGNPLSKVGVFHYLGSQISPDLEPNTIYNVYRPEEELANPETIDSFKLLPWTDEHSMLGGDKEAGYMPAEKKGIHGVTGQEVYFEGGYLKANLKVFSEKLADLIESGKKELSIGYRCLYEIVSGFYNGVKYDAIQRNIRGNHLALVDEGRAGPDVAVLDHFKFTVDSRNLIMPKMKDAAAKDADITLESLAEKIEECMSKIEAMHKGKAEDVEPKDFVKEENAIDEDNDKDDDDKKKKAEDEKEDDKDDKAEDSDNDDDDKKDKKSAGMDAKIRALTKKLEDLTSNGTRAFLQEVSKRDALANQLSHHIGTFDHKEKTLTEVAAYGIKKLGLKCKPGHESSVLDGFLAASRVQGLAAVQDSKNEASGEFLDYISGGK